MRRCGCTPGSLANPSQFVVQRSASCTLESLTAHDRDDDNAKQRRRQRRQLPMPRSPSSHKTLPNQQCSALAVNVSSYAAMVRSANPSFPPTFLANERTDEQSDEQTDGRTNESMRIVALLTDERTERTKERTKERRNERRTTATNKLRRRCE